MKKVSIIIPCYNGEKYIDCCMQSIFQQDYPKIEIIVVDDGSKDNSKKIIELWEKKFQTIGIEYKWISQKNGGPGSAINTGLKYVTGEYLSLLDIDDEYRENAISDRVKYLDEHKEVDVVRTDGYYVKNGHQWLFSTGVKENNPVDIFEALIRGEIYNWAGSYMVRTDPLFQFYPNREIYESRYGQNLQILLPLLYKKKCGYIDEPHMNYNRQENSLSQASDLKIKKARDIENIAGYRDIYIYMLELIIKDEKERKYYLNCNISRYWRRMYATAIEFQDKELLKSSYKQIKIFEKVTLREKVNYYQNLYPVVNYILESLRRVKRKIRR